jgi:hypothetical protein
MGTEATARPIGRALANVRGMRRALVLAALLGLALVPAAGAAGPAPAKVEIGRVGLSAPVGGRAALLVPVRYPIQLNGQRIELRVFLRVPGQRGTSAWTVRTRAAAGPPRVPDRRRSFVFVHGIDLGPRLTRGVEAAPSRPQVRVEAPGALDINRDGVTEVDSDDEAVQALPRRAARRLCSSVPQLRAKPGEAIGVELPACGAGVRWRVSSPAHGSARVRGDALVYRSAGRFRGTESIELRGRLSGGGGVEAAIEIVVEPVEGIVARAIGDSFTAGFGYRDDGSPVPLAGLPGCAPAASLDDACSSNSTIAAGTAPAGGYAPDYGLSNNVSWAAQWASGHGVSNYENLAVSGSGPSDWAAGGRLHTTTERVEAEGPDDILLTVGAEPLLSQMLFGGDATGCASRTDVTGAYRECVEAAFRAANLRDSLEGLYRELVDRTGATVDLMQYPVSTSPPGDCGPAQIAELGTLLNREIAAAAATVSPARLLPIGPPQLSPGDCLSPLYPYPAAAGYAQMAAQVPAP